MHKSGATKEEILNRIAAIRAAAEILHDEDELSHSDRQAFLSVIESESARLYALVRQIASLLPRLPATAGRELSLDPQFPVSG